MSGAMASERGYSTQPGGIPRENITASLQRLGDTLNKQVGELQDRLGLALRPETPRVGPPPRSEPMNALRGVEERLEECSERLGSILRRLEL
jgi:hypothetical protein